MSKNLHEIKGSHAKISGKGGRPQDLSPDLRTREAGLLGGEHIARAEEYKGREVARHPQAQFVIRKAYSVRGIFSGVS